MKIKQYFKYTALVAVLVLGTSTTIENNDHNKYFEISKNIEIFTTLYKEINTYYVDDLDPAKLMRTGIDAMLESLDPFTNYISESEIEGFRYITEGRYFGVGAAFRMIDDYATIDDPHKDSPADKSGLKAGDRILEVDGQSAKGRSEDELRAILQGYPGTSIDLTIQRPGETSTRKISLTRDEIRIPNVPYSGMISEDIGYVVLTTFTRDAGRNVGEAVKKLKEENPNLKGIVFDLRDNGGGLLTEAVNVSNIFIDKGELVVTTKGKVRDRDRSFKTLNQPIDKEIPLVILIDEGTASASEIVSGTIQDLDRGLLMGQQSYGKGLVQNTRDIGYNSKVKMTIAKYYIPSGRCIQSVSYADGEPVDIPNEKRTPFKTRGGRTVLDGGGVQPDIKIDLDDDSDILKTLDEKHIIFKYVTDYCLKNPAVTDVENFKFEAWDDFLQYLAKNDFDYDTESERLLKQLKVKMREANFPVEDEIATLEQELIAAKKDDLQQYKSAIINLIEKEIASRYFYQEGRIKIGLRNDKEIQEAIELLGDTAKYQQLLKAQ